ncbi:hypothetical protein L1987_51578 [Smallanthus sonchifolius]|uniref:Uncharacterized protein n=1 Tax=Smallanthus sonchifolius TaxID=185202 RepID=A0ACB9EQ39_9ASTR|nr:hypothetical protein L1987_51578 [Smallanthus sonchifolius]
MEVANMRDKVENEHNHMKKQEAILQESIQNLSPTHEFSFTMSLNPHPPSKSTQDGLKHHTNTNIDHDNEMSPADDIFFQGHLLPLHHTSHLPVSPRPSTNSLDGFTLPMKDILNNQQNPTGNTSFHYHHHNTFSEFNLPGNDFDQTRPKSKSFSIFSRPKWKKDQSPNEGEGDSDDNNNNNSKKKLKLLIKKYMKMVKPFMLLPKANSKRLKGELINRQPHSFSCNFLSTRNSLPVEMNRRGKFSAPVSMRTSRENSGILLASGTVSPAKGTTSDSTMEELQAAIQAAIAHCKNSIAIQDKVDLA